MQQREPTYTKRIREPVVEGIFYPGEKKELERIIKQSLEKCDTPVGEGRAILVPHAGYGYCSSLLAAAFKSVALKDPSVIVCLGPTHTEGKTGLYLTESESFRTPLGEIEIAEELSEAMLECSTSFVKNDIHHMEEHCLEIIIPYIQTLFPKAKLLPILVHGSSPVLVKVIATALNLQFSKREAKTLFIVTSNLFGLSPKPESLSTALNFISLIKQGDPWEIVKAYEKKEIDACGTFPVAGLLAYLTGSFQVQELGIVNGDFMDKKMNDVPLYGAFCFR